jgi:glycogen(starch) synthase
MTTCAADRPTILFEVAWEVCSQIGGIYTVIKTKAPSMVERWGKDYVLVGPYHQHTSALEFEHAAAPDHLTPLLERLSAVGIPCYFGYWLTSGRPAVILVDYQARQAQLGSDKYYLWKDNGIGLDGADGEVDATVAFGFCVAELFSLASQQLPHQILGHFHEWMAGVALPRIRHMQLPIATVFTTHATLLGRYVASNDPHFYSRLADYNADQMARQYMIWPKYAIERAAAHSANIFTTVSEVTAQEADALLGRKPEFVLPNGLNPHTFTALHEFQNLHMQYKERIHEFVMGHFFPSYSFDLDRTLYVFTSGRYEYSNKGMDIFIESLYRLNQRLKGLPKPPTVVAFIITRAPTKSLNVTSLQHHLRFEDLKTTCRDIERSLGQRILEVAARGRLPTYDEIFSDEIQLRLKRSIVARRTTQWPPVVTHDLWDDANDPVMNHLRHRGLLNSPDDPVKVVFHPDFVSMTSLLSLDYEQFVRGCHIGVFPSYYEPWGYTPLECLALGIPTVTTDLSGFGSYVGKHVPDALQNGVLVLQRSRNSNESCIENLASFLAKFCELNRRERIALRNRAERITERFSWDVMAAHYHRAHTAALARIRPSITVVKTKLQAHESDPGAASSSVMNRDVLITNELGASASPPTK